MLDVVFCRHDQEEEEGERLSRCFRRTARGEGRRKFPWVLVSPRCIGNWGMWFIGGLLGALDARVVSVIECIVAGGGFFFPDEVMCFDVVDVSTLAGLKNSLDVNNEKLL